MSEYSTLGNNPIRNIDPKGDYFWGLLGSTSEQRQAARSFAKENGGEVRNLMRRSIHVNYNSVYKEDGDFVVSNRNQHFRSNGRLELGAVTANYFYDKQIDYWNTHGVDGKGDIYEKRASGRADYFAVEAYFVPLPPIFKIFRTSKTVSFFAVQGEADALRLMKGGSPWPLSPTRAHLGEGLYVWGTQAEAETYRATLLRYATDLSITDLSIMEFTVKKSVLNGMKKFVVPLEDEAANMWLGKYSSLFGEGLPHGFQYVQRSAGMGMEHYFSKDVFNAFKIKVQ